MATVSFADILPSNTRDTAARGLLQSHRSQAVLINLRLLLPGFTSPLPVLERTQVGTDAEEISVQSWCEELLQLAVRHSDVGIEPDLAEMDSDELYGVWIFLRKLEAGES